MPGNAKTHLEFRSLVCLCCWKKGSSPRNIGTGVLLKRIQAIPKYATYTTSDQKLPSVCCGACNKILTQIEKGEKTLNDLPEGIDLATLKFPVSTPHQLRINGVATIDQLTHCECTICEIGRQNGNHGSGNTHWTKNGPQPFKKGRPKAFGPSRLPDAKPVKICDRCKRKIGPGIPHPQPCKLTDLRESVHEMNQLDPRGFEIAVSEKIKEKMAEKPNSSTISLATKSPEDLKLTIAKPTTRSSAKKALFVDSPVPISEFEKMRSAARLTGNQADIVAKFERSWHGRKTFEPSLHDKIAQKRHSLKEYHSTAKCMLDSSDKKERLEGKVERIVVYNNDFLGCMKHLAEVRGYSLSDSYLKISGDTGQGSLKITINLENIGNTDPLPTTSKKQKFSYSDGLMQNQFKDSGVRRLIIVIIVEKVKGFSLTT